MNTVKLEFSKKWSKLSFIFHNLYMYIGYNCWTKFSIHWYNFKLTAILSLCLWSLSIVTISIADVLKHLIVFYRLTGLFLDQLMRVFFFFTNTGHIFAILSAFWFIIFAPWEARLHQCRIPREFMKSAHTKTFLSEGVKGKRFSHTLVISFRPFLLSFLMLFF